MTAAAAASMLAALRFFDAPPSMRNRRASCVLRDSSHITTRISADALEHLCKEPGSPAGPVRLALLIQRLPHHDHLDLVLAAPGRGHAGRLPRVIRAR